MTIRDHGNTIGTMTEEELEGLKGARSQEEWDLLVGRIKEAHGGSIPSDWAEKVEASGLKQRVTANFGTVDLSAGSLFS
jgi:hypothetical protein